MSNGSKILLILAIILVVIGAGFLIRKNIVRRDVENKAENNINYENIIDEIVNTKNEIINDNVVEKSENTSNNITSTKQLLLNVMNNKQKFINEDNKEVFLKDFKIVENQTAKVDKYAFVDMDKDGTEELVIYTTSDYGAYVILHYENDKVYGYMIGVRSLENLKTDGSFMGSSGANSSEYSRMTFNKSSYSIQTEAVYDTTNKVYEIDNTSASEKQIKEYVENWNKKENVSWSK